MNEPVRNKGIYLLPNLFTIAAIFAGFYAIVAAMKGQFDVAAMAIFIAMIADGLDGRVARLTNTESAFGAQLDSLSDMIAFGVAPALVAYSWCLSSLGKIGWLAAFFYTAATALRLARFNIQSDDPRYFTGFPSTSAAGLIAGMIWFANVNDLIGRTWSVVVLVITVLTAVLMVSNVRYYSFKHFDLRGKVPFVMVLSVVIVYMLVMLDPGHILFIFFLLFALSGFVTNYFYHKKQGDGEGESPL